VKISQSESKNEEEVVSACTPWHKGAQNWGGGVDANSNMREEKTSS
jgi:hypothetical protein